MILEPKRQHKVKFLSERFKKETKKNHSLTRLELTSLKIYFLSLRNKTENGIFSHELHLATPKSSSFSLFYTFGVVMDSFTLTFL